jgi:hypothetical protein
MQIGSGFFALALAAVLLAPSVSNAGDVWIGGKGPRMGHDGRWASASSRFADPADFGHPRTATGMGPRMRGPDGRRISAGRPVFVLVDDLADFGHPRTATAPPLRIEVKGDVDIVPLENGGIRIQFVDE